ncbi:MAG: RNA methyltransferase [Ruminiclostridium sp.]|nr:RNA methyltransferase [Ruminiclostridium sp.]
MRFIQSRQNQIIKDILAIRDKKNRRKEQCFLIEGFRFVREALLSKAEIKTICVSSDSVNKFNQEFGLVSEDKIETKTEIEKENKKEKNAEVKTEDTINIKTEDTAKAKTKVKAEIETGVEAEAKTKIKIIEVPDELFRVLSQTDTPQGILAVVGIPVISLSSIYHKGFRGLILDSVQDPGNAGTIIRSAHALGFDAVLTTPGTVDVFNSKALRATMGSIFNIPVLDNISENEILAFCNNNSLRMIVSRLENAKPCYEANLAENFLFVIGNEGKGVSVSLQEHASEFIHIPMPGGAESFNAAVAASIIMYESFRQRNENIQ